jgi:hypothetical protein
MATSAFKSSVSPAQRTSQAPAVPAVALAPVEVLGVLAYPSIVEPDPQSGNKFNTLVLITDPEDQQKLEELVAAACEQTFRSPKLPPGAHNPLRDANEKNHAGEYAFKHPSFRVAGGMVVRAKTAYQPQCVWGPEETEIDASEIHGGDKVAVQISAYGYSNQSQGVGLSLGRIWLIKKGETKIERGSGAGANIKRIDRSRLRFNDGTGEAA